MTDSNSEAPTPVEPPKKKKRVDSKKKGNGFEGHISKVLGEALSPMKFRRSQSSGAILGGSNEKFMEHFSEDAKALFIGDVVPTNEADIMRDLGWKLRFTLECKFYKTPPNLEHLFNEPSVLGWFEQARTDSLKISKLPLLIFKYNHTEIYCAIDPLYCAIPTTVTKVMSLQRCPATPGDSYWPTLSIFNFKESLKDLAWWKTITNATITGTP